MAIKKEMTAWAIKLSGRSFLQSLNGFPFFYKNKSWASTVAMRVHENQGKKAEPVRVKIKVEEV